MTTCNINFQPIGRRGTCSKDQSLLDAARQLNIDLVSICGGVGSCERCKVQLISGSLSDLTPEEFAILTPQEQEQGYRLACQAYPLSDITLHVPAESLTALQRTQVEGLEIEVPPQPPVLGFDVSVEMPTIHSPMADDQGLWSALNQQHSIAPGTIDFRVQQVLGEKLRASNWQVNVAIRGNEIVAVDKPSTRWLGLAVDIGTTKIAAYLLDLESGKTLASKGMMNPQISYGEDVVARILAATKSSENAVRLQTLLVDALNQVAVDLCAEIDAPPTHIVEAVVVGNTAIHHLFLALPVKQLGLAPYVPATCAEMNVKARDLGIKIAPGAYVHLLPNIAGYVGADHVAMLLASRILQAEETTLAIDIGTNTEICLKHGKRMTSVSCASGPAFEGAHIMFGMRAAPGAIEHVRLKGENLEIQTIGSQPPVGICGSGLLDVVAQLRLNEVIDRRGKLGQHSRVRFIGNSGEFILAEPPGLKMIVLTQKDVRELQLAKAAIRLGIQALVEAEGIRDEDIQQVIIAGAFGTFIDVESAITIGMLPNLPLDRFKQVGNAAGSGARLALISTSQRAEARLIAQHDYYIELATMPNFSRKFAEATYL